MIWTSWRQFRTQALFGAVAFVFAAAFLILLAIDVRAHYHAVLACLANGCDEGVLHSFQDRYSTTIPTTGLLLIAAPGVLGVFWGAPLVSTEFAAGTHRLAWHQSVTRTRWLAVKLAVAGATATTFTGLLGLLLTWAASPYDTIAADRFAWHTFGARGLVPFAAAAFAFVLGAAAGALLRRPIAAMGVTLLLFLGVQFAVPQFLRPNYLPARQATVQLDAQSLENAKGISTTRESVQISGVAMAHAWVLSASEAVDAHGDPPGADNVTRCFKARQFADTMGCFATQNLHVTVKYQPATRYWPFQMIETALYAAVAALLAVLCFWSVRSRVG